MKKDNVDIEKSGLPIIKITMEEFQNILDAEGYDMKAEDVIKQRREYLKGKRKEE
jgi:hypothetical protein